jgi:hypothetical protein
VDSNAISTPAGIGAAIAALLAVLLALLALLDVGPFADDELTVEEFIAQGDAICGRAHDEFHRLQERAPLTAPDAAELTGGLIEVAAEERDAIADLSEPESLAEPLARYLDARDRGIDLLHEGQQAAEDADPAAYEDLQVELASTPRDPRYDLARELGFRECSKPLARD